MAREDEFVRRRIYLTLERGRDLALRNLFRKVFIAGGFEEVKGEGSERIRRTRIPVAEFAAAVRLGSKNGDRTGTIESDEVECLLANLIYKVGVFVAHSDAPCRGLCRPNGWGRSERADKLQNLIKGYISRERATVVLSKAGTAFPGTGV